MINLALLNKAEEELTGDEFKVLYIILNKMSKDKTNRVEIHNWFLMQKMNCSESTIQRITRSLQEKEYIFKVGKSTSKNKIGNIYTTEKPIVTSNVQSSVPSNLTPLKNSSKEEKKNKTIDTIGPSTRNSADEKYEESTLNFDSSSKTRSELESEHYDTVVVPQLRRIEEWDENPEPEGYKQISVMSGWNDFPQAADWFENDIKNKVSEEDWNLYLCINFNRVKDKYLQRFRSKVA